MPKAKRRKEKEICQPPSPPRWKGKDSVDLAYHLNQRTFELVRDMAGGPCEWPLIGHNRTLWTQLDVATISRAVRFPFVILDVHFTDIGWWDSDLKPPEGSHWPANVSEPLMGELLVFAWHTAKWDRRVARLSFGMLPGVAELIAAMTPHKLDRLAAEHCSALRLRWQDNAGVWTRLLEAARDSDEETLIDIHLHAKLLLSGELIGRQ